MNISNLFHSLVKRLRPGEYQDPSRDWTVLLIFSAIVLIGVIVWNMWAFSTVARGGVIGSAPASSVPVFSTTSLDAVHAIFEKRAAEEIKYETGTYRYADPSQ